MPVKKTLTPLKEKEETMHIMAQSAILSPVILPASKIHAANASKKL
jgi:hypothetical protein